MKARAQRPTQKSSWDSELPFRVWAHQPVVIEDKLPWKCVAVFRFLQEALDYMSEVNARGVDVVFQSPAYCDYHSSGYYSRPAITPVSQTIENRQEKHLTRAVRRQAEAHHDSRAL